MTDRRHGIRNTLAQLRSGFAASRRLMFCRYDAGDCRMTLNIRTKMLISSLLLAGGGSGLVTPGSAQTRILDTGTRVRVLIERQPSRFIGAIATVRPDTIILTVPGTRLGHRAVAVKEIAEL